MVTLIKVLKQKKRRQKRRQLLENTLWQGNKLFPSFPCSRSLSLWMKKRGEDLKSAANHQLISN